ncbi:unnamed protein product, partial [Symbiodinium microadriaticum]
LPTKDAAKSLFQLSVCIYQAEQLAPVKGMLSTSCNPFVQVDFNGTSQKTQTQRTTNPTWNEEVQVPFSMPAWDNSVNCTVFHDGGMTGSKVELGEVTLDIDDLANEALEPTWFYFYKAPDGKKDQEKSEFGGRLLLSASMERTEKPILTISPGSMAMPPPVAAGVAWIDLYMVCFDSMEQPEQLFVQIELPRVIEAEEPLRSVQPEAEGHGFVWKGKDIRMDDQVPPFSLPSPDNCGEFIISAYAKFKKSGFGLGGNVPTRYMRPPRSTSSRNMGGSGKGKDGPTSSAATAATANPDVVRDNYIPLFDGQPSSYKEYRKRVALYYKKMSLASKKTEATINLLTSLSGPVWKQVEHLAETAPDDENGFNIVLQELDRVYQYDSRVEMPKAFERFFYGINRPYGQTLIQYCSDHREAARELERHDVKLPDPVGGWLLLRRAALTAEQRQLVMSQVDNKKLSVNTVEQALFYLFGQDYRSGRTDPRPSGKGRGTHPHRWSSYRTHSPTYPAEDEEPYYDYYEPDHQEDSHEAQYYEDEPDPYEEEDPEATDPDPYDGNYVADEEEADEVVEEAYAAYLDARRRFAEVRAGRGYYPVVAMVDPPGSQMPVAAMPSKGKPPKGKGKSKSTGRGKFGGPRGPAQSPKGAARADSTRCLRCGQVGHWASQCPKPPAPPGTSAPSSPNKRPKQGTAMMAMGANSALAPRRFGRCVGLQDGGASSMVGGHDYVMEVITEYVEKGLDPETLAFTQTNKSFLFGGDHRCLADWSVHLPVWIGGTKGRIQCFLVEGAMPILIGRPLLKALKVEVDYDTDMVSVLGEPSTSVLKGPKGEHLLALDDGMNEDTLHVDYDFDYVTDDCVEDFLADGVLLSLGDYLKQTGRVGPVFTMDEIMMEEDEPAINMLDDNARELRENSKLAPAVECPVPVTLWKSIIFGINRSKNSLNRHLEAAYRASDENCALFWEVYSGSGNLSAAMRQYGFQTRTFDLPEWNFEDASHRRSFFDLLEKEMPHIVWLAPPCTKWSPLQNLTRRTQEDLDVLQATRDYEHHTHLLFVRRVFLRMAQLGIAVIEHPLNSKGNLVPIKKATKLVVNHQLLTETLGVYRCDGTHRHQTLAGSTGLIGSRAKAAGVYQPKMCGFIAEALQGAYYAHFVYGNSTAEEALPASDVDMEEYEPSDAPPEDDDLYPLKAGEDLYDIDLPTNQDIEAEYNFGRGGPRTPAEAQRIVARLHRNLGHPNNRDLRVVLAQSGANRLVVETAENYQCPTCRKLAPPVQVPKTTLRTTFRFNERLLSDTVWLQVLDKTVPVITMMDAATRYVAARVVRRATSTEFLQALERGWIRVFGPPRTLFVDSHRAWGSDEVMRYATEHGVELVISPGEAHERLAQLERRHQVLRRAVELYLEENPPTGQESLVEALCFVIPQLNQSLSVGGFSPTQWVLGYQPNIPGSLLDSNVNYSYLDPTEAFQHKMQCRVRAATAVVKADNDLRLRRALLRQHRGNPPRMVVGQKCFYWREAAGTGPRIRWKGPATVVLVESQRGPEHPPTVYWLVHGSALIRAAPEHVRPDLESDTLAADTAALHTMVRHVQNRGTTVYLDLFKTNKKRRREDLAHSDDEAMDDDNDNPPPPPGQPPLLPPPPSPPASSPTWPSLPNSSDILDSEGNFPDTPSPSSRPRGPPPPRPPLWTA